jgi:hypothetical protein
MGSTGPCLSDFTIVHLCLLQHLVNAEQCDWNLDGSSRMSAPFHRALQFLGNFLLIPRAETVSSLI